MRIHWGMGRFWAIFFASVRLVRNVLCDGCGGARGEGRGRVALSGRVCSVPPVRGGGGETRRPAALFWRRSGPPLHRSARSRRAQESGILRDDAAVVYLAVCPGTGIRAGRGPRAAAFAKQELRPARARRVRRFTANQLVAPSIVIIGVAHACRFVVGTYHGCQIAVSLFCARQDKSSKLPIEGVQSRACSVEGRLRGRLKRKLPDLANVRVDQRFQLWRQGQKARL